MSEKSCDEMARELQDLRAIVVTQAHMDQRLVDEVLALRKRIDKLEREAEAKARTAHYPPPRPLREPTYRTLGRKTGDLHDHEA